MLIRQKCDPLVRPAASELKPSAGQRYRAVGTARQSSTLWQVVAVVTGTDGRSYAKLTQVSDPTLTKTVTTDAVLDGSMYERAA